MLNYDILLFLFEPYASRNIVSTVNLDCKLDLKQIALQARNAEYNPKVCLCLINFLIWTLLFLVYVIPHLYAYSSSVLLPSSCGLGNQKLQHWFLHLERWWVICLCKVRLFIALYCLLLSNLSYPDLVYYQWFWSMLPEMEQHDLSVMWLKNLY